MLYRLIQAEKSLLVNPIYQYIGTDKARRADFTNFLDDEAGFASESKHIVLKEDDRNLPLRVTNLSERVENLLWDLPDIKEVQKTINDALTHMIRHHMSYVQRHLEHHAYKSLIEDVKRIRGKFDSVQVKEARELRHGLLALYKGIVKIEVQIHQLLGANLNSSESVLAHMCARIIGLKKQVSDSNHQHHKVEARSHAPTDSQSVILSVEQHEYEILSIVRETEDSMTLKAQAQVTSRHDGKVTIRKCAVKLGFHELAGPVKKVLHELQKISMNRKPDPDTVFLHHKEDHIAHLDRMWFAGDASLKVSTTGVIAGKIAGKHIESISVSNATI